MFSFRRHFCSKNTMNYPYKIYLTDSSESHENLLPLSFTRPIADFRVGITTLREKWEFLLPGDYHYFPVEYLREKFGDVEDRETIALYLTGATIADENLAAAVASLSPGEAILDGENPVAFLGSLHSYINKEWKTVSYPGKIRLIKFTFDVFLFNPSIIAEDFRRLTGGRTSQPCSDSNRMLGPIVNENGEPNLFIEEGATVEGAIINLKNGPVYIGRNAEIMEGSCVRGPLALCDNAKIRMGAKIYGGCTFGPFCKVGGEIDNSVLFAFSNKAHDGYLGNAVVGEWCNIGAGVNASNLKNDYTKIRIWNYHTHTFMRTDLQFCGPIIGDHTKIGVNCMLNTATVLGVGVNIHGAGFPRVFVPSFSEGSAGGGFTSVSMKKFDDIAERVMSRRNLHLTEEDTRIYEKVYQVAAAFKG